MCNTVLLQINNSLKKKMFFEHQRTDELCTLTIITLNVHYSIWEYKLILTRSVL